MRARRLVILWDYYQHYHLARLAALETLAHHGGWQVIPMAAGQRGATVDKHEMARPDPKAAPLDLGGIEGDIHSAEVARNLLQELNRANPDAVMFPGYGFSVSRAALRWCRKHRRGAVMMFESTENDAVRSWPKELLKRLIVRQADSVFCGGRTHAAYAAKLGIPIDRVFLKYSVVDNDYWRMHADAARIARPSASPPRFLAAGRFIPKKNFTALVEAFGQFKKTDTNGWRLVLVGDGPEGNHIRAAINQLNLTDSVDLPGYLTAAEIAHLMGVADIFVMPSLHGEQWGLVVNEAMATGLPVIVSQCCGCAPDLVDESATGLLFDPGNPGDLLRAMRRLAEDCALRSKFGSAGQLLIQAFSVDEFARQAMAAVAKAIDVAQGRSRLGFPFPF
jgi:glycosyltransferase involved in cell wall biosynthesis